MSWNVWKEPSLFSMCFKPICGNNMFSPKVEVLSTNNFQCVGKKPRWYCCFIFWAYKAEALPNDILATETLFSYHSVLEILYQHKSSQFVEKNNRSRFLKCFGLNRFGTMHSATKKCFSKKRSHLEAKWRKFVVLTKLWLL